MIVHPNLARQFSGIDFSRVPKQTLSPETAREILQQVEADWDKFDAYDQTPLDRDPKNGRLDVYKAPARYQAEVLKNSLYVSESIFPNADPNGVPVYFSQRESEQNDNQVIRYEADARPEGMRLRRFEINRDSASLQEWFSACPALKG